MRILVLSMILTTLSCVAFAQETTTTSEPPPPTTIALPLWCSDRVNGYCVTDPSKVGYGFVQSCPPGLECLPWDQWKCRCR